MHITKFVLVNGPVWMKFKHFSSHLLNKRIFQSYAQSLSGIVSSILNLQCHLQQIGISQKYPSTKTAAAMLLNAIEFWSERMAIYKLIGPLALDLLSAPASQAFVERIFSLCGLNTTGRRNRMKTSLQMHAFLKLN